MFSPIHSLSVTSYISKLLSRLDFAGLNKIGFDWGSEMGQVYLRYKGKPIMLGTANAGNISQTIAASYGLTQTHI